MITIRWLVMATQKACLAARIWKVEEVDLETRKIYVVPAKDGKKPMFTGSGVNIHPSVHHEMFNILSSGEEFDILDQYSRQVLKDLRKIFSGRIQDPASERLIITHDMKSKIYIFGGTKVASSLRFLLLQTGLSSIITDNGCTLEVAIPDGSALLSKWQSLLSLKNGIDSMLTQSLEKTPHTPFD